MPAVVVLCPFNVVDVSKPFRIWKKGFCHEVVDIDIGWLVGWLVGPRCSAPTSCIYAPVGELLQQALRHSTCAPACRFNLTFGADQVG